ncbi:dinitrogenase iron-molybdenum cofactor biosynthesis protein [candidate division WOR-3 bacterium]|uniref:Dinitrogenase iron-molybdenum cofactor biosynthesis protein n=1 Tax=candidate division WOR-3 bacterium TaxID=2052148 RepID=A0A660SLH2_UNCW3|nr:MAG: dinitrogenase iron-molybdenum cofactor biosynthesis protein [candidate division WOR-3 bacterium]
MKIAIVTEDKTTISEHLGGAPYFMVVTIEGDKVVNRETRKKIGHKEFAGEETHPPTDEKGRHGFGPRASERHQKIFDAIKDCDVLIAGRMGLGAYTDMQGFGLKVICTDVKDIEEAVSLYLTGKLTHREDRVC